jgi:hypothetical protein
MQRINKWRPDQIGAFEVFASDFTNIKTNGEQVYNQTQSRKLLCQPSSSLHQLGLYITFKSAHNHSVLLGFINSILYNNQNFSSKSHSFRLIFLGAISRYPLQSLQPNAGCKGFPLLSGLGSVV